MYFKQREDVLFRQYDEYGYITDNSEFGYRMLNDNRPSRGEKFVSQSGAVMLSTLSRRPRHIDDIVDEYGASKKNGKCQGYKSSRQPNMHDVKRIKESPKYTQANKAD